jgi:molecular chaperone DnaK (HSP70)
MAKAPAIGIDLGTSYCCVGVSQRGKVEIIANDLGNRTTPSYVAFRDTERLIGESAKNEVANNPSNTIFGLSKLKHICDINIHHFYVRDKANSCHFFSYFGNKLILK